MMRIFTTKPKQPIKKVVAKDVRRTSATSRTKGVQKITKGATLKKRSGTTVASPYLKKIKRYTKHGVRSLLLSPTFHSTFKIISVAMVSFGLMYTSYFFISKVFANEVIVSQSEIVARVAKLTTLPHEDPYEIVRVQDEEDLRKQNPFYKDIKEGDYILVYKNMAVIYDLRNNVIVGVKQTSKK